MFNFRGDRGLQTPKLEEYFYTFASLSELIFAYALPVILNLTGFVSAVVVFKVIENEHLQNIAERTFLMTPRPKRLCTILWIYIFAGVVWIFLQLLNIVYQLSSQENLQVKYQLFEINENFEYHWVLKVSPFEKCILTLKFSLQTILISTLFIQNTVQVTILLTYSIFCILLRVHLRILTDRLIYHNIENVDWMKVSSFYWNYI